MEFKKKNDFSQDRVSHAHTRTHTTLFDVTLNTSVTKINIYTASYIPTVGGRRTQILY